MDNSNCGIVENTHYKVSWLLCVLIFLEVFFSWSSSVGVASTPPRWVCWGTSPEILSLFVGLCCCTGQELRHQVHVQGQNLCFSCICLLLFLLSSCLLMGSNFGYFVPSMFGNGYGLHVSRNARLESRQPKAVLRASVVLSDMWINGWAFLAHRPH